MNVTKHTIAVEKTARYISTGEISASTKNVWIVLHGYGQLVPYFIKNFQSVASNDTVIIAPEGLSRFYLEGVDGRIGASWMTREERLEDIADYINYLDILYEKLFQKSDPSKINISVLGFSQGGATASRWLAHTSNKVDNFILWSSVIPDDMSFDGVEHFLSGLKCFVVYGLQDPFLTPERQKSLDLLEKKNNKEGDITNLRVFRFTGGHNMDKETLDIVSQFVNR